MLHKGCTRGGNSRGLLRNAAPTITTGQSPCEATELRLKCKWKMENTTRHARTVHLSCQTECCFIASRWGARRKMWQTRKARKPGESSVAGCATAAIVVLIC